MNASKENCVKAQDALTNIDSQVGGGLEGDDMEFIREFLNACERKLPTEAAYKRERQRRKKK